MFHGLRRAFPNIAVISQERDDYLDMYEPMPNLNNMEVTNYLIILCMIYKRKLPWICLFLQKEKSPIIKYVSENFR